MLGLMDMVVMLSHIYIHPQENSHVDGAEGSTPDGANQFMRSTNAPLIDSHICAGPVLQLVLLQTRR